MRASVFIALLLLTACRPPRITLKWDQAARLAMPPGTAVAFEVDPGPPPDGKEIAKQVIEAMWLRHNDRLAAVKPLEIALAEQLAAGGYRLVPRAEAAVVIWVRPTGWKVDLDPRRLLLAGTGKLNATVEVRDPSTPGQPPVFAEKYWATQAVGPDGHEVALRKAAARVVGMLLQETRPGRMSAVVLLDDSDPVTRTGIALCQQNQFRAAYEAFAAAVTQAPQSPAAHYNFGVMAEIQGLYDIAENAVRRATQLESKPLYFTALERIGQARADAEKLKAAPPP
jgi:tetratricopeptide (TPR) repeat protein